MGNFSSGIWNIIIIVVTLGGLAACWLLTMKNTSGKTKAGETVGHTWDGDLQEYNNPLPRWWVNMFYLTIVFAVVYLLLYPGLGSNSMFLGWTQLTQYEEEMAAAEATYGPIFERYREQPIEKVAADQEALKIGRRLYATYCTGCHGSDAGGVRGFPNLRDGDWLWGGTPEAIETSISAGRNGMMPAWKDALGGDEGVRQVTQFVLTLAGRDADAAAAEQGKTKFGQFCAACHGAEGKGNPMLGAPNLTDDVWLYGGSAGTIEQTIALGRQGRMPAHGEFLGPAKVHLLAAYVYSLSK
ncbi:MAG: cytochrome-c oxidase, cbb3-type subunit III [Ectothiorhodospiraceae bacterium]|nr:cytochrome-c oxidase, cbb3-type subunit III [Chromatiales bacterium]MCP5153783.1 cytochrome-c oxidase, cbb3-type subunit III [Ectothiorhodospiraceae bacterium]